MKIGVQFFTIRDYCQNLNDFSESLKKVADMGFTTVQISGVCPYEPAWLAEQLKSNGLTCGLTHYNYDRILNETEKVIEEHKQFGCKYIGVGSMPGWDKGLEKFLAEAPVPAQKIHDAGCQFMYHNHAFEYENHVEDGRNFMQVLSDAFTPEQLGFTLDTYWVKYGGEDVLKEISRLKGRLPVVHFKDMFVNENGDKLMSWVGGGNVLDFEKIIPAFEDAGTELAYIEQDNCNGENPFDCLKKSYQYLKSIGLL